MANSPHAPRSIPEFRRRLLDWYERNRRELPWRQNRDPYSIWVSEIMLQQTRVAAVVDRYTAFLTRFPTLASLALSREDEVLALWSGLGYYRRARMLHKAAQFVVSQLGGNLPARAEELRRLPGIGGYTAAAIASIAHDEPVAVLDGNVARVLCRLAGWDASAGGTALERQMEAFAGELLDCRRPGEWNQAMMELGAMLCTPRSPQCPQCPVAGDCATRGEHRTAARPRMLSREVGYALAVRTSAKPSARRKKDSLRGSREVLLEQRPASASIMPGLWELPTLLQVEVPEADLRMTLRHAILQTNYYARIRTVFEDDVEALAVKNGKRRWVALDRAGELPLTGLARKVLSRAHLLPTLAPDVLAPRTPA